MRTIVEIKLHEDGFNYHPILEYLPYNVYYQHTSHREHPDWIFRITVWARDEMDAYVQFNRRHNGGVTSK